MPCVAIALHSSPVIENALSIFSILLDLDCFLFFVVFIFWATWAECNSLGQRYGWTRTGKGWTIDRTRSSILSFEV